MKYKPLYCWRPTTTRSYNYYTYEPLVLSHLGVHTVGEEPCTTKNPQKQLHLEELSLLVPADISDECFQPISSLIGGRSMTFEASRAVLARFGSMWGK